MFNPGNNCYLNSAVQALFHCKPVSDWLQTEFHGRHRKNCKTCAICLLSETLYAAQSGRSLIDPSLIYQNLSEFSRTLTEYRQEDPHEFLVGVLEACMAAKPTAPLDEMFLCDLLTITQCGQCKKESAVPRQERNLILDIHNQPKTLEKLLEEYLAKSQVVYRCDKCETKTIAAHRNKIVATPEVLFIQLNRFKANGAKKFARITINTKIALRDEQYKLSALIEHMGHTKESGHYTATCAVSGKWFLFDDSKAPQQITEMKMIEKSNPYLIFYTKGLF